MTPDPFSPDMLDFLRVLGAHQVRYLLIGGYAVHVHGHVRVTSDIDFAYCPRPDNAERLYAALADFWGSEIPNGDQPRRSPSKQGRRRSAQGSRRPAEPARPA